MINYFSPSLYIKSENLQIDIQDQNDQVILPLSQEPSVFNKKQRANLKHLKELFVKNYQYINRLRVNKLPILNVFGNPFKFSNLKESLEFSRFKKNSLIQSITQLFSNFISLLFGKSTPLTQETIQKFEEIVQSLPIDFQQRIFRQLKNISTDEQTIFQFLRTEIDMTGLNEQEIMSQILLGAYIIIDDKGQTYETWSKLKSCQPRFSSHAADDKQYAIRGSLVKECLFSRKQIKDEKENSRTVTWFQLERYPVNFKYFMAHLWTYILYKRSGQNQGPYGSSLHSEHCHPFILKVRSKDELAAS